MFESPEDFAPAVRPSCDVHAGGVRPKSKLEPSLLELVKMRASQINGCAYCIDMHSKDARAEGRDRAAAVCAERMA